MKDSDKKILLALLAVAILVATFLYVYKPIKEDMDNLDSEIETLQARYNDLKQKQAQEAQLKAETEEFNAQFEEILAYYPADLNQETTVMLLKGVEEQYDFIHDSVSMTQPTAFYVLGQGATTGEEQVVVEGDASATEEPEEQYTCYMANYPIAYTGTYDGLKSYLDYIATYKYRMNIDTISITYDPVEETCKGSLTLNEYAISGPNRTPDTVDVDVPNGVDNIFIGGSGAASAGAAVTSKYDADNGAAIVNNYNVMMLLNNANSDSASGIIVAADRDDENTYVSSNENAAVNVKISVYAAEGKNYVSYEIGDQSYEAEVLTDDVTVYVKSSGRVDSDDQNSVNVTVSNTTSLPVFFKVADDDTTAPRFKVASKSGVVKVY